MMLFKTSGKTFKNVIEYKKHAFKKQPKNWKPDEIILVSKNREDCKTGEKQIQYIMFLVEMRLTNDKEFEKYWPNNISHWKYIADCSKHVKLQKPFNILDVVGQEHSQDYGRPQTFKKIDPKHEDLILNYLKSINALD